MSYPIPELLTWIGGEPESAEESAEGSLHDPNTGEPLQDNRASSPNQVERAVSSAWGAHLTREWQDLGIEGRAPYLRQWADLVDARQDAIAILDSLNSGVTLRETKLFAGSLGDTIRSAVAIAEERGESWALPASQGPVRLRRVAWGPTALIAPWNAPSAVAVKKMAYALIAGAPVILKPSPASPWSSQLIARAAADAKFPEGIVSLLLGGSRVGDQLSRDPRIKAISMTGATATGRLIAHASAANLTRLRLELSSNNPALVLPDANVDDVVKDLVGGATKLNGQWCEAPRRVLSHRSLYADVVSGLAGAMQDLHVGSSFDNTTDVGPMAFEARRDDLARQCADLVAQGAVSLSGVAPTLGWFFPPTVVSGPTIDVAREIFGPMLVVEPYDDLPSAIARANEGPHGLGGYVFARDVDQAIAVGSRLDAGEVKVNGTSLLDMSSASAQSFFGDSGLGGHGDADVLDFYSGKQVVGVDLLDPPM